MSALTSAQWKDHWVVYGNLCVTLVPDRQGKGQRYSLRIYVFRGSLRIIWPSSDLVFLDSFIHSFIHSFHPRITYCVPSLCQSLCGTLWGQSDEQNSHRFYPHPRARLFFLNAEERPTQENRSVSSPPQVHGRWGAVPAPAPRLGHPISASGCNEPSPLSPLHHLPLWPWALLFQAQSTLCWWPRPSALALGWDTAPHW